MKRNRQNIDLFFKKSLYDFEEFPPKGTWDRIADELNKYDFDQETDNLFKEKLHQFEENPPLKSWDNILNDLDKIDKRNNLKIIYRIAASVILAIGLGSGYIYYNHANKNTSAINEININNNKILKPGQNKNILTEEISHDANLEKNNITEIISNNKKDVRLKNEVLVNYDNNENNSIIPKARNLELIARIEPKSGIIEYNYNNNIYYSESYMNNMINGNLFAENNEIKESQDLTWMVGGQFSPVFSNSVILNNNFAEKQNSIAGFNNNTININDENLMAYSGGFNINVQTGKRFELQSGIYYSSLGQRINDVGIFNSANYDEMTLNNQGRIYTGYGAVVTDPGNSYFVDHTNNNTEISWTDPNASWDKYSPEDTYEYAPVNGSQNTTRVQNMTENYMDLQQKEYTGNSQDILNPTMDMKQTLEFIEIPVVLKYKVFKQRFDFQLIGGFSTNMLINNDLYYINNQGNKNYISQAGQFKKVNYASIIGLGIKYPIINRLFFNFEPAFKYNLNKINTNSEYSSHPYSFAIYSGLSYKF